MNNAIHRALTLLIALMSAAQPASIQGQTAEKVSFEVASIKIHPAGEAAYSIGPAGDRFVATNVPLRLLVQFAVRRASNQLYLDTQIVGGPSWINTDRFDVQAKAEAGARTVPFEQIVKMAQSLLEDRFQLKTHREMRDAPVYALVQVKTGSKLTLSADQTPPTRSNERLIYDPKAPQRRGSLIPLRSGDGSIRLSGVAVPMPIVVNTLQGYVDRPVIDFTDLTGLFDFRLEFVRLPLSAQLGSPEQTAPIPTDSAGPQLFTAIQEQLGLKLEPRTAPVEVLVIDHAEHPTED